MLSCCNGRLSGTRAKIKQKMMDLRLNRLNLIGFNWFKLIMVNVDSIYSSIDYWNCNFLLEIDWKYDLPPFRNWIYPVMTLNLEDSIDWSRRCRRQGGPRRGQRCMTSSAALSWQRFSNPISTLHGCYAPMETSPPPSTSPTSSYFCLVALEVVAGTTLLPPGGAGVE